MTLSAPLVTAAPADRSAIVALAGIEARRYATHPAIWLGWLATVAVAVLERNDWPGGAYEQVVPLSFAFLALGTFAAAVQAGARDRAPLAAEAVLDAPERATARLLGLAAPAALAALTALGTWVAAAIEGGFWLGDTPRRTDTANYSALELLQPVLLVVLAGALGLAVGRSRRGLVAGVVLAVVAWTALFPLYWVWNSDALYPAAPIQTMPLRVRLPFGQSIVDTPADWFVERPTRYTSRYTRTLVHPPTVALHHLYLCALIAVAAAGVSERRRLAIRCGGLAVAAVGVALQFAVSPV